MTEFGVGTYIRNVVRALGRLDHDNEYFLVGSPARVQEIGPLPPNFQTVPLLERDTEPKGYLEFRKILNRLGCDLVHIPQLFWLPRALPCPYVMTVHDVLEHLYRAHDRSGLRRFLHFQLPPRLFRGPARIFAVSKFTKSEIEKLFGIPASPFEFFYKAIE